MAGTINLTAFGFTPTESLIYEVLIRGGPGTGYAIARSAGLARANAYSALEGLVQKGAARVDPGRPKRYRPEPPANLIAQLTDRQARALDELSEALTEISVPSSPSLVELQSTRGTVQLLAHEIARAKERVDLSAPGDAFPLLTPALRKAAASGVDLHLSSDRPIDLPFAEVSVRRSLDWPGEPLLFVVDRRGAIIGSRSGDRVAGYWGTDPITVAAAIQLISVFSR